MLNPRRCSQCGAPLPAGVRDELCLVCAALDLLPGKQSVDAGHTAASAGLRQVGDYELLKEIARGGMGVVFRARQLKLNRYVAVKLIREGGLASPTQRQRFFAEARAAARLRHPNIVAVHEVGEHEGVPFFSMELVEGPNLAGLVAEGPLTLGAAAELLRVIAEAVDFAHRQGILHRDLKPENILLDRDGQPRVTDFGLARQLGSGDGLTLTGQLLGSPAFMSPEQAAGRHERLSPSSDVYSLGGILYFLLTARAPVEADSLSELLALLRDREPTPPRQLNRAVPVDLETICLKCLRKEPANRYETAAELAEDLARFLRQEPVRARPVTRAERIGRWCHRHPARVALIVTAFAALLAAFVGIGVAWQRGMEARRAETQRRSARAEQLLIEARHARQTGRIGQRFLAVGLIREARALDDSPEFIARLRDEGVACLLAPDIVSEPVFWIGPTNRANLPAGLLFSKDLKFQLTAEGLDNVVRRTADGLEVARVSRKAFGDSETSGGESFQFRELSPSGRRLAVDLRREGYSEIWDLNPSPASRRVRLGRTKSSRFGGFLGAEWLPTAFGERGELTVQDLNANQAHEFGFLPWTARRGNSWTPLWSVRRFSIAARGLLGVAAISENMANNRPLLALFDVVGGTMLRRFEPSAHPSAIAFNPGGDLVISVNPDQSAEVWDALTGRRLLTIDDPCVQPGVGKSDRSLGVFWRSNRLEEVRLEDGRICREWRHTWEAINYQFARGFTMGGVESMAFSPDGRYLLAAYPPRLGYWDLAANQAVGRQTCHSNVSLLFHPALSRLFITDQKGIARWDFAMNKFRDTARWEFQPRRVVEGASGEVALSADGKTLAIPQPNSNHVLLVRTEDFATLRSVGPHTNVSRTALSPDARRVVTAPRHGGEILAWDAEQGTILSRWSGGPEIRLTFSPDGRWLAGCDGDDYTIRETSDWQVRVRIPVRLGQNSRRRALAFSPNGRWLAVLRGESDVALVDTSDWKIAVTLPTRSPSVFSTLCFNRDGSLLAAGGEGGQVCVWDLPRLDQELSALNLRWPNPVPGARSPLPMTNVAPMPVGRRGYPVAAFPPVYPTNAPGVHLPGDYNLRRDFSITQNPNGPWSYGWKSEATNDFRCFAIPRRDQRDNERSGNYMIYSWCEEPGREPALIYHPGHATNVIVIQAADGEQRTWFDAPASVRISPPPLGLYRENAYAGVRFTAPEPGAYEFRVRAYSLTQFRQHRDARIDLLTVFDDAVFGRRPLETGELLSFTNILSLGSQAGVEFLCRTMGGRDAAAPGIEMDVEVYRRPSSGEGEAAKR